ncbi:hypothetical protein LBMAG53_04690 [Planctomycetota bacterium]|nr:hypothetical protein LBMAG53_04690 [Planctomycetota bacterium]
MTSRQPDPHDLQATVPAGAPPAGTAASATHGDRHDLLATIPAKHQADRHDLQATLPAGGSAAGQDQHDALATVPASGAKRGSDHHDQQATLPMARPQAPAPAGGDAPTLATTPAGLAQTLAAGTATSATGNAATLPVGTQNTGGGTGSVAGTGSFAMQTQGSFAGRTGTFGRTMRTKVNHQLVGEHQSLDQRLQLSRTSVLAEMATTRMAVGAEVPTSVSHLVESQGTEGRYLIDKPLAEGGMGAVLRIEDHDFRRQAAMKIIKGKFAGNVDAVERFLAEAQVTAQLEHPNIVPVHDLGVMEDGSLYYTMKLIEGVSLGKVVKLLQQHRGWAKEKDGAVIPPDAESEAATKRWTENYLLEVFLKVLDGVGFANSKGVIHRDLKPDNVMVGAHGEVLVVDWGIAKILKSADRDAELVRRVASIREVGAVNETMAGSAMGTIYYMPPEQAKGELELVDARADVYALGATLYEMLSLKRSVTGSTLTEMLVKVANGQWTSLDEVAPHLHPDLVAIVHKSMSLDLAKRYRTCEEFAEDLRRYAAGRAVSARQRSIAELIKLWIIEHRMQLGLGAGAIALVAASVTGGVWWAQEAALAKGRAALAQAESELQKVDREDPGALRAIQSLLQTASDNLPKSGRIDKLAEDVATAIGGAEQKQKEAQKAAAAQAARLADAKTALDAARTARTDFERLADETRLKDAAAQIRVANQKDPGNPEIESEQQTIIGLTARLEEIKARRAALAAFESASKSLTTLAQLDPVAAKDEFDALAVRTGDQLALAAKWAVDGSGAAAARLARLTDAAGAKRAAVAARQVAAGHADEANRLIASAQGEPHAAAVASLTKAHTLLDLALKATPGETDLLRRRDEVGDLQRQRLANLKRGEAVAQARQALDRIAGLLAQGDHAGAREQLGLADGFAPNDDAAMRAEVAKAGKAIDAAETAAARTARLAIDARTAVGEAESAQQSFAALNKARGELVGVQAELAKLELALAAAPLDQKKPLLAARDRVRQLTTEIAERWATTEAAASRALSRLSEQPDNPLDADLRKLLGAVYYQRLQMARRDGNLNDLKAYTNLIARLGDKAQVNLSGEGKLTINAPAGTKLTLRRLEESSDGRLVPTGEARDLPVGLPTALPGGRWQVNGGEFQLGLAIEADGERTITLPEKLPRIPGFSLRWVPPGSSLGVPGVGGTKGFLLAETETTLEQYLPFLLDKPQFDAIAADIIDIEKVLDSKPPRKVIFAPFAVGSEYPQLYKVDISRGKDQEKDQPWKLLGISLPAAEFAKEPVSFVDRNDADSFCRWLAKRTGLTVRLPASAERALAANGGDDLRIYPWGPRFDGLHAASALSVFRQGKEAQHQVAAGSFPADTGPFGHRDLGGNVREWLFNRPRDRSDLSAGTQGGLVGGGGYSDESSFQFRSDYSESVEPIVSMGPIGFRILVEIP